MWLRLYLIRLPACSLTLQFVVYVVVGVGGMFDDAYPTWITQVCTAYAVGLLILFSHFYMVSVISACRLFALSLAEAAAWRKHIQPPDARTGGVWSQQTLSSRSPCYPFCVMQKRWTKGDKSKASATATVTLKTGAKKLA